eukprot:2443982-Prymnesium_polylepis.1
MHAGALRALRRRTIPWQAATLQIRAACGTQRCLEPGDNMMCVCRIKYNVKPLRRVTCDGSNSQ